jgi:CHASE3 domain sensor protein
MLEVSRLIAEVHERHGIRMDPSDVGFALVTLNQLMLEELAQRLQKGVSSGIAEFNEVVQKTETRAGKNLAQCVKAAAAEIREELQRDIDNARVQAAKIVDVVNRAHSRPAIAKWVAVGLIAGMVLFGAGLWVGAHSFR